MPKGSTTRFTATTAASSRAAVVAAIQPYRVAAGRVSEAMGPLSELKIDELRNLRHQHQRDAEQAPDGHRPACRRLPSDWWRPIRVLRRVGAFRAHVAGQLLRVRREPGDCQERGRNEQRGSGVDRAACHGEARPVAREQRRKLDSVMCQRCQNSMMLPALYGDAKLIGRRMPNRRPPPMAMSE